MPANLKLEGAWRGDTAKFQWDAAERARAYEVRVTAGGIVRRQLRVGNALRYDYTAADMRANGGPWRSFELAVRAIGQYGGESAWTSITASNPQAAAPVAVDLKPGIKSAFLTATPPADRSPHAWG